MCRRCWTRKAQQGEKQECHTRVCVSGREGGKRKPAEERERTEMHGREGAEQKREAGRREKN